MGAAQELEEVEGAERLGERNARLVWAIALRRPGLDGRSAQQARRRGKRTTPPSEQRRPRPRRRRRRTFTLSHAREVLVLRS